MQSQCIALWVSVLSVWSQSCWFDQFEVKEELICCHVKFNFNDAVAQVSFSTTTTTFYPQKILWTKKYYLFNTSTLSLPSSRQWSITAILHPQHNESLLSVILYTHTQALHRNLTLKSWKQHPACMHSTVMVTPRELSALAVLYSICV